MTTTKTLWVLRQVLDGLAFPAQKWQILAQADLNGVDSVTRERLRGLPEDTYPDVGVVAAVLDQASTN